MWYIDKLLQGLVVPVMRNVENMNYADIEKGLNELGEKVSVIITDVTFL